LITPMLLILASHQAAAQDESSTRAYFGVQLQEGALVRDVDNNSPAQIAGIEPGDLVVRFDGKDIKSVEELSQTIAAAPIGKEIAVAVLRGGKEGTTTAKLGQRLVLSGAALDAFRQKLGGMLQELGAFGDARRDWNDEELQRFSELFAQFEEMKKTVPPRDETVQKLWAELEREFKIYKTLADNLARQREARGDHQEVLGRSVEQLSPAYENYMTLQVCAERFPEFEVARSRLRNVLKNKETAISREEADKLWNSVAMDFQKVEDALGRAGMSRLHAACEQAAKQSAGLVAQAAADAMPPLRKKDF